MILCNAVVILGVEVQWLRTALIKAYQHGVTQKGYILLGAGMSLNSGLPSGSAIWNVGDGFDYIAKQAARNFIMVFISYSLCLFPTVHKNF